MSYEYSSSTDPELLQIKEFYINRYYIGNYTDVNGVYIEPDLVDITAYNMYNPEKPLQFKGYLEPPFVTGNNITIIDSRCDNNQTIRLDPELSNHCEYYEDYNPDLVPQIETFLNKEEIIYIYNLYGEYHNPYDYIPITDYNEQNYSFIKSAVENYNPQYDIGRESVLYRKWRDYQNAYATHINQGYINKSLDEHGVKELKILIEI